MNQSSATTAAAAENSSSDEPTGDKSREAIASLRGYAYQLYASALAWLDVQENESLWLEVAEDYAIVARGALDAVQVKDTATSGSVTLRSQGVRDAIDAFVNLSELNKDRRVTLRFLTTSTVGREQKLTDRPGDIEGLLYWRKAADGADVGPLRDVLLAPGLLSERAQAFVRARDDVVLRKDLLCRIHWDCGSGDIGELQQELKTRLISYGGSRLELPPSECARIAPIVIAQVLQTAATQTKRRLDEPSLLALVDDATRLSIRRKDIDRLLAPDKKPDSWLKPFKFQDTEGEQTVTARRMALGREPSWRILRQGLYCPRPTRLREAAQRLDTWLKDCWADDTRMPAFWIDGRSGDGKSVFLLQLIADLLVRNPHFQIKVCSPNGLAKEIEQCELIDGPALFVVDDLHKVIAAEGLSKPSDDLKAQLTALLDRGIGQIGVLACGPTPEMEGFRTEYRDSIAVATWTMPPVDDAERLAFASWLGLDRQCGDGASDLLVEFLFELKVGQPLLAFAQNFRQRLERRDAFLPVKRILAVNSLDLAAEPSIVPSGNPTKWLQRLERDDQRHFELSSTMLSGARGIRFAHTRIAWRLFVEWTRDPELNLSIDEILAEELAPSLLSVQDRLVDANSILTAIWRRYPSLVDGSGLEGSAAGLVIQLSRVVVSSPIAEAITNRAFVEATIQRPAGSLPGELLVRGQMLMKNGQVPSLIRCQLAAGLLYVSARDHHSNVSDLSQLVHDVLFDAENEDHSAAQVVRLASLSTKEDAFKRWAREWFSAFPNSASLPTVATWLCRTDRFKDDVVGPLLEWLGDSNSERLRSTEVLAALLAVFEKIAKSQQPKVLSYVLAWLRHPNKERLIAYQIWASLIVALEKLPKSERPNVTDDALGWLDDVTKSRVGAQMVLEALLATSGSLHRSERARVIDRALTWIEHQNKDRPGIPQVLASLLSISEKMDRAEQLRLTSQAFAWLGNPTDDRPGVQMVLESLLSVSDKICESRRITNYTLVWLDTNQTHPKGYHVLASLLEAPDKVDKADQHRVIDYLFTWLGDPNDDRAGIHHVLRASLIGFGNFDESELSRLVSYTLGWLGDLNRKRPNAHEVITALLLACRDVDFERSRAVNYALDWLDALSERDGDHRVAAALCYAVKDDARIRSRLIRWASKPRLDKHLRYFVSQFFVAAGADVSIRAFAETLWDKAQDQNSRIPLLLGLASAYPDDPTVVSRILTHLAIEGASMGPQIAQCWLEKTGDPASVIKMMIELPGVRRNLGQIRNRANRAVQIALARAIDRVFAAIPLLVPKDQETIIHQLRKGVRRVNVEGAAQALLDRINAWPHVHTGVLFRALIESPLETTKFADQLLSWLKTPVATSSSQHKEVVLGLADNSRHDDNLMCRLTPDLQAAITRARSRTGRPKQINVAKPQ